MVRLYLSSVIVWIVIMFCSGTMCLDKTLENGWIDIPKKKTSIFLSVYTIFAFSCVPFVRMFIVVCFFYMAAHKKGE